ncbi:MAG: PAS domain-containing protein, partial [Flavobacteriales bacterium]
MAKSLSNEDLIITPELRSRPCPMGDPAHTNHLLNGLIAKLNGGSTALLKYLADALAEIGGGDAGCTGGVCLVESGPDGEQRMRLVATSEAEGAQLNFNLSLGQCPCSLCLGQPGVMLLKEPQRHFEAFNPTTRPIAELLLVPFGTGTPEPGTLWLAAHGDHRFHQGHADALQLLAEQGSMVYQNVRERERMAARLERRSDQNILLDHLPVGIAKLDQEYRYTYLNDRAIASLKTSQDHLLGRSVWEAYPEVAGTCVEEAYRRTMEQGEVSSLELYFTPVETWFDLEAHPAEGGGIVVFFFDARQRKLNESDLVTALASEERNRRYYTTILNTTPDFAYIWGADYKFLYANKALLDLYGLKEE